MKYGTCCPDEPSSLSGFSCSECLYEQLLKGRALPSSRQGLMPPPKGSGKGSSSPSKKDARKLKRNEKENLWRKNYKNQSRKEPLVLHFPKDPIKEFAILQQHFKNNYRSALQTLHRESGKARDQHYFQCGLTHDWLCFYERCLASDQSCINEWNALQGVQSKRPPSPDDSNKAEIQLSIRHKLKDIMMSVNIDEVTSKYIRERLEGEMEQNLFKFKSYIDEQMLVILGQMDSATEIFPHVYLGSEWNASNLDELKENKIGYILNVTKEIDNFYPGMFDYLNIRVYDDEKTELLKHWEDTYKYITQAKRKQSRVLVHCRMGISRSASVVIAYAMKEEGYSLDEALKMVKEKRSCINPNSAFLSQLKIYQGILDASRQRYNNLWRSKSETNLKAIPLHTLSNNMSNTLNINSTQNWISRITAAFTRTYNNHEILKFKYHQDDNEKADSDVERMNDNCSDNDNGNDDITSKWDDGVDTLPVEVPRNLDIFGEQPLSIVAQHKRPKSWSPEEDGTKGILNGAFYDFSFGECWPKSRSLNEIIKLSQNTMNINDFSVVETINPNILDKNCDLSSPVEDIQMSSSVRERINEFENVQGNSVVRNSINNNVISNEEAMTGNNNNENLFEESSLISASVGNESTLILDRVIDKILSPSKDSSITEFNYNDEQRSSLQNSPTIEISPVLSSIENKIHKCWTSPNLSGFDPAPKTIYHTDTDCSDPHDKIALIKYEESEVEEMRKEDVFSTCLDNVFDREEKKEIKKVSPLIANLESDKKDTPSRNNSWGSFDSAVVLPDRDLPSRNSSWGSCDTRNSVGSVYSRNSSFSAFDTKQGNSIVSDMQRNICWTYFNKDGGGLSTVRRVRVAQEEAKTFSQNTKNRLNCNASPDEAVDTKFKMDERSITHYPSSPALSDPPSEANTTSFTRSQPNISLYLRSSSPKSCISTMSVSPESEIPPPGTVQQQKKRLESFNPDQTNGDTSPVQNMYIPFARSLSYGCMEYSNEPAKFHSINRSLSEKRASNVRFSFKSGKVRRITRDLQRRQNVAPIELTSDDSKIGNHESNPRSVARSHSLERLHYPPLPPSLSSQNILGQLVAQTQLQASQLENEEVNVKSLVGLFEESTCQEKAEAVSPTLTKYISTNPISKSSPDHSVSLVRLRPRSESLSNKEAQLPPVPQRKSSLEYDFNLVNKDSKSPTSISSSVSPSPSFNSEMCVSESEKSPGPPRIVSPTIGAFSSSSRLPNIDARRKKEQGKTHPLSKLVPR